MFDKARTLQSFYKMLRGLFDPGPNKHLIIYLRDGRRVKIAFKVEEVSEERLRLVEND